MAGRPCAASTAQLGEMIERAFELRGSVSTETAAAPPACSFRAARSCRVAGRMTPAAGERSFTSAITSKPRARAQAVAASPVRAARAPHRPRPRARADAFAAARRPCARGMSRQNAPCRTRRDRRPTGGSAAREAIRASAHRARCVRGKTRDLQRQRRAQHQRIAMRGRVAAASTALRRPAFVALSPPRSSSCAQRSDTRVTRVAHAALDAARPHVEHTNGPSGVGSSQPARPWTTKARSIGRPASASAISLRDRRR